MTTFHRINKKGINILVVLAFIIQILFLVGSKTVLAANLNSEGSEAGTKTSKKYEVQPVRGNFTIIKQDEDDGTLLKRAVFELVNDKNDVVMTLITNENGEATAKNIPGGAYTLREVKAPGGYELDSENKNIYLDFEKGGKDKNIKQIITNKKIVGNLKITKVDKNNLDKVLQGAEFALNKISENDEILKNSEKINLTGTTNKNGVLQFKNIPYGKYTLTETKAPKGYKIDAKEQEIEIRAQGQTVEVIVKNKKIKSKYQVQPARGNFTIIKQDVNDGTLLKRAVIELVNDKNEVVMTLITNENGQATAKNIYSGVYTLREVKAPGGYQRDRKDKKINLNFEETENIKQITTSKRIK